LDIIAKRWPTVACPLEFSCYLMVARNTNDNKSFNKFGSPTVELKSTQQHD